MPQVVVLFDFFLLSPCSPQTVQVGYQRGNSLARAVSCREIPAFDVESSPEWLLHYRGCLVARGIPMFYAFIPNMLTALRILLTPVIVSAIVKHRLTMAITLFLIAAATDFFDGFLARRLNRTSSFGAYLDPIADKLLLVATFTALFVALPSSTLPAWFVFLILIRELILVIGGSVMWLLHIRKGHCSPAIMAPSMAGKLTTFLQIILIAGTILSQTGCDCIVFAVVLQLLFPVVVVLTIGSFMHYVGRVLFGRDLFSLVIVCALLAPLLFNNVVSAATSRSVGMIDAQNALICREFARISQLLATRKSAARAVLFETAYGQLRAVAPAPSAFAVFNSLQTVMQAVSSAKFDETEEWSKVISTGGTHLAIDVVLFLAMFRAWSQTTYVSSEELLRCSGLSTPRRIVHAVNNALTAVATSRWSIYLGFAAFAAVCFVVGTWCGSSNTWRVLPGWQRVCRPLPVDERSSMAT